MFNMLIAPRLISKKPEGLILGTLFDQVTKTEADKNHKDRQRNSFNSNNSFFSK